MGVSALASEHLASEHMATALLARSIQHLLPRAWGALLTQRSRPRFHEGLPRKLTREGVVFAQHIREGRFQRGLGLITAGSALLAGLEVAYEHYRGSYGQRIMYSPVLLTPPLLAAGLWSVFSPRAARLALPAISSLVVGDGLLGFYFHVRGIQRKPGGWRLPISNIVMGPPIFAPLLFAIPGYLGLITSYLRREDDPHGRFLPRLGRARVRRAFWQGLFPVWHTRRGWSLRSELREGRFQKHMAVAAAATSIFSGFEALYSHYKNNFRFKAQWTPVAIAPLLSVAGVAAVFSRRAAHTWLPVASALAVVNGGVGFFYHARGVARRAGGTQHLLYNIMYGPPIFAPLLFAASGFLGLLASLMRRER
jgi:hypothetical protein